MLPRPARDCRLTDAETNESLRQRAGAYAALGEPARLAMVDELVLLRASWASPWVCRRTCWRTTCGCWRGRVDHAGPVGGGSAADVRAAGAGGAGSAGAAPWAQGTAGGVRVHAQLGPVAAGGRSVGPRVHRARGLGRPPARPPAGRRADGARGRPGGNLPLLQRIEAPNSGHQQDDLHGVGELTEERMQPGLRLARRESVRTEALSPRGDLG